MYRYDIHEHLHLPHWRLKGLSALYVAATLRTLAYSLVGIFVPIFIYQLKGSIVQVLLFFLVHYGSLIIFNYPVSQLLPRLGFPRSILIGNLLLIAHVLMLNMAVSSGLVLYLSAVVLGMAVPFYWIPYHLIFTLGGIRSKLGEEIGLMQILGKLANVAGPLMGGVIIAWSGFSSVYIIAAILLVLATAPIFLMEDGYPALKTPRFKKVVEYLFGGEFRKDLIALAAIGGETSTQGVFWPLFLFIFVGGVKLIGSLTTGVLFMNVGLVWFIGKWVDRDEEGRVLHIGAAGSSLVWLVKPIAQSLGAAFVVDSIYKISKSMLTIPFDALVYERAVRDPVAYMVAREWAINGGRFLTTALLIGLIALGANWWIAFLVAAVASLGTMFLDR